MFNAVVSVVDMHNIHDIRTQKRKPVDRTQIEHSNKLIWARNKSCPYDKYQELFYLMDRDLMGVWYGPRQKIVQRSLSTQRKNYLVGAISDE